MWIMTLRTFKLISLVILVVVFFGGCGCFMQAQKGERPAPPPPPAPVVQPPPPPPPPPAPVVQPPPPPQYRSYKSQFMKKEGLRESKPKAAAGPAIPQSTERLADRYKEYQVDLGADKTITMPGPPGLLKVWIGIPNYESKYKEDLRKEGMTVESAVIPALGDRARVTPLAPAFKVEPKDSGCIRIDPTGSQVSFTLTPTQGGTFDVGADVALYDTSDCSGTPIPKGTTTLKVQVVVKRAGQFLDVFWQELLKFWGVIIALFFAVIVFLIRKQLKKWIGFGKDDK